VRLLTTFVIASSVIFLTGCDSMRVMGSETSREVCRQMGAALPTRSHRDTQVTIDEITELYATFSLVCPIWEHLIPGESQ
jgi:hypothetical protein